jgi:organic radical activating enzyme
MIFCTAPFTGLLVDADVTIKPCCAWGSNIKAETHLGFGKLTDDPNSLLDIINSKERAAVQEQILKGETPPNCRGCEIRYNQTGHALNYDDRYRVKSAEFPDGYLSKDWQKGITVLEINSNNTCNLACGMCNSHFSSAWLKYEQQISKTALYRNDFPHRPPTVPVDLIAQLKKIDLTFLDQVIFKGGEPLMNPDLLLCLQYFSDIGILSNISIFFNTNGTILNKEMESVKQLLDKTKKVIMVISVDGVDEVQTYIRYSPKNFASTANIENFIDYFTGMQNVNIYCFPTISVYNIFSLDKIVEWGQRITKKHDRIQDFPVRLDHFVISPDFLSINVLSQTIINELIQHYTDKDPVYYKSLIFGLKAYEYLGDKTQYTMIRYTLDMDKIKGQDVFKAVPELKPIFLGYRELMQNIK